MKKRYLILALLLILSFTLVACSKPADDPAEKPAEETPAEKPAEETPAEEPAEKPESGDLKLDMKSGFVTDEGGIHDESFNQSAWEGLQRAGENIDGLDVTYMESHKDSDYDSNLDALLDEDCELIWAAGFKLENAMLKAAEANPDVNYALIDADFGEGSPSNLLGIMFKAEQPSFLCGYIAAHMTETDKVGFVGGIEGNIIWGFDYGYRAGVDYAAKELGKDIEVLVQYVGNFSDQAAGKSIATSMFQQGADIVFHAAGGAGIGVIEAAKDQGKWAIGVDADQSGLAPDNVLTSAMKRVDVAIENTMNKLAEGEEFSGGKTITYGLEDHGAVDIAPTSDVHVPKDILDKVETIKQEIIDGNINVPFNEETYETFVDEMIK
ncbi:MAG: BMP family ABC transporter substrate-binding protein [Tissierellia bacterium]|nr:BMP family ABC transporter substrate-binding protein [Tissierellia bacterium]